VVEVLPMTPAEAIEAMEALGHDFFVFRDRDSNTVQVRAHRMFGGMGREAAAACTQHVSCSAHASNVHVLTRSFAHVPRTCAGPAAALLAGAVQA
jgi:hypothetical protein